MRLGGFEPKLSQPMRFGNQQTQSTANDLRIAHMLYNYAIDPRTDDPLSARIGRESAQVMVVRGSITQSELDAIAGMNTERFDQWINRTGKRN